MVLSSVIAITPAMNWEVLRSTVITWFAPGEAVEIASGFCPSHSGSAIPAKSEKPKMKTLRELDKSQYLRLAMPTPVMSPNMTQNKPPITGSGMVTKNAENLENMPRMIRTKAAVCIIRRDAARVMPIINKLSKNKWLVGLFICTPEYRSD